MKAGQALRVEDVIDKQCHTDLWIECKCGHHFWWNTYEYGSNIVCNECDQAFYAIVILLETISE